MIVHMMQSLELIKTDIFLLIKWDGWMCISFKQPIMRSFRAVVVSIQSPGPTNSTQLMAN
jgi:hypothetical protein